MQLETWNSHHHESSRQLILKDRRFALGWRGLKWWDFPYYANCHCYQELGLTDCRAPNRPDTPRYANYPQVHRTMYRDIFPSKLTPIKDKINWNIDHKWRTQNLYVLAYGRDDDFIGEFYILMSRIFNFLWSHSQATSYVKQSHEFELILFDTWDLSLTISGNVSVVERISQFQSKSSVWEGIWSKFTFELEHL